MLSGFLPAFLSPRTPSSQSTRQAPTWHTCPPTSTPSPCTITSGSTTQHYMPTAAQDQQGNVYLFWDQNPGIFYTVTTTGNIAANLWPAPQQYTIGSNYDIQPTPVVLKNGTLVMFYSSQRGSGFDIYYARYNAAVGWSTATRLTTDSANDKKPTAIQDSTGKLWVAWTRSETGDLNIKFVDTNGNGIWDPGETIVYDSNGNGAYDNGEPVIAGTAPANGTLLKVDPRIGFIDSNNNRLWDPGEFVVYDPNADSIYNPKIRYVDSNLNSVWDVGETLVYNPNATGNYTSHTGNPYCAGTKPAFDCVIVGQVPPNQTRLQIDTHLKFIDLNGDGLWEPGETIVYDSNNNGRYDTGEQAVPVLTSDPKLRYIGSGTWAPGNTVVYDINSNSIYDGRIQFVDTNGNGHWDPGETVVYHNNLNTNIYDLFDIPIYESVPQADLGKPLRNDPSLRFVDSNNDGVWEQGEAVVYDYNKNNLYDGKLKFFDTNGNGRWDQGEPVIYDANNDGKYSTGKYYNDTLIAGAAPANNTLLTQDKFIKFYDPNGNTVWDLGEPVVYDANDNNLYDAEVTIAGSVPTPNTAIKNDPKILFAGPGPSWTTGNPVLYDTNGDGKYTTGRYYNDTIIAGTAPANNTLLIFDPKVKFVNATANPAETWALGKSVVYDANGNNRYDAEQVIAGTPPLPATGVTTGLGEPVVAYASPVINSVLKIDIKVKFFDTNGNGVWDPGEPVVYDTNGNNVYESGKPLIAGPIPFLNIDAKIKFFDTNGNGVWDAGEPVIYDTNNDGKYSTGKYYNDTLIAGAAPANNTLVIRDPKLKFVDANADGIWEVGETVVYDANGNNLYDLGEPVIAGTAPTLKTDPKIKYVDGNGNGVWDSAEAVMYDANNDGLVNANELIVDLIRGTIPPATTMLSISLGEPWIAGPMPIPGTFLSSDPLIKFVDLNGNLRWDQGEAVAYDANNNGILDAAELIIVGNPFPPQGTLLKSDEMTIYGRIATPGTNPIVADARIKFVPTGTNTTWVPGETVVYDKAGTGHYAAGKFTNDTIIAGAAPANNTALAFDLKLKYFEQVSPSDGHWDTGEPVFYDANNNGIYDANESIVAAFPVPSSQASLVSDPKIQYFDSNTLGHWVPGDPVVYHVGSGSLYTINDLTIGGPLAPINATLTTDPRIKFVNTVTGNATWDRGKTVVYDANNNGKYDPGEPVIVSTTPAGGTPLRSVTHVFYKSYSGASWSAEQRLTTMPRNDFNPSLTQTEDGRLWIVWEADRGGGLSHQIVGRTSLDGTNWTPEVSLTNIAGTYGDSTPTLTQDRDGTIWLVWSRNVVCTGCVTKFEADLFLSTSTNNGATWTAATAITSTTTLQEITPSVSQLNDKNVYVFFTTVNAAGDANLYYFSSLVQIHDARMNTFASNVTITPTYGPTIRSGEWVRLMANVSNTGDFDETFKLTIKANATIVATNTSTPVPIGQSRIIIIDWKSTGMKSGRYTITANVTVNLPGVEGFANLIDNTASFTLLVRPAGDVNGDCIVNVLDVGFITGKLGTSTGMPGFSPKADLNYDGQINILDVAIVTSTLSQTC